MAWNMQVRRDGEFTTIHTEMSSRMSAGHDWVLIAAD